MTFVTAVYNSGRRRGCRSRCCAMPVLILALLLIVLPRAVGQSNIQGKWTTLPYTMPINPIHAALLNTGKVRMDGIDRHRIGQCRPLALNIALAHSTRKHDQKKREN